jgi:hypothetical protein
MSVSRSIVNPYEKTWDFYDHLNDPRQRFQLVGSGALFVAFLAFCVWSPLDIYLFLMGCFMLPLILLALPRIVRKFWLASRGAPVLRLSEAGVWAREWSSLGWINWRNVVSVEVVSHQIGRYEIQIHLRDEEFARLASIDQLSVMLVRLANCLASNDTGANRLLLTRSSELKSTWEDFISTLDPILVMNGVAKSQKSIRA